MFEQFSTYSIQEIHQSLSSSILAWNYAIDSQKMIEHTQFIANNILEHAINEISIQQQNNVPRHVRKKMQQQKTNNTIMTDNILETQTIKVVSVICSKNSFGA